MEEDRDPRPWPYSVGQKGINRVRVYDRYHSPDSSTIQIEWWDDRGRQQRALNSVLGVQVTDRTLARDIAEELSAAQLKKRGEQADRAAANFREFMAGRLRPHTIEPEEVERG